MGRSFYSPDIGRKQSLGDGLESWRGFYQSIRPTQMGLSLNIGALAFCITFIFINGSPVMSQLMFLLQFFFSLYVDMSSTAFIEALPVTEFVCQLLNRDIRSRPLSDADRVKV